MASKRKHAWFNSKQLLSVSTMSIWSHLHSKKHSCKTDQLQISGDNRFRNTHSNFISLPVPTIAVKVQPLVRKTITVVRENELVPSAESVLRGIVSRCFLLNAFYPMSAAINGSGS